MNTRIFILIKTLYCLACWPAGGQTLYVSGSTNSNYILGRYNVLTCQFCPELIIPVSTHEDMQSVVALPNGLVLTHTNFEIYLFDPPNATPLTQFNVPSGTAFITGAVLAPNGKVYISGYSGGNNDPFVGHLYEYDPVANTMNLIGSLPPNTYLLQEMFYWNGQLHAFFVDVTAHPTLSFGLASVQVGNPLAVTVLQTYSTVCGGGITSIQTGPNAGIYNNLIGPGCNFNDLSNFDITNNTNTLQCPDLPFFIGPHGMSEIPPGFPAAACLCLTDAGAIPAAGPYNTCTSSVLTFPSAVGGLLDANDILRYVLFTNPNDTAGSIIATSNTPNFTFAPPMQTGVTYYVAAVAGNNLNGNVDLSDPCLDFSNANAVVWRPLPTVAFTAANLNLCAGECRTVTATFTGTPPFNLTYTTPAGTVNQTFAGMTGTIQVCAPAGAASGPLLVQATNLVDAWCTCQ